MAATRLTLRQVRANAAIRSARARARRAALQRPEGRDVALALGDAFVEILAQRGIVKADGRVAGVAALQAHPDLAAVMSAATQALADRFAPTEVAAVLQARLAA